MVVTYVRAHDLDTVDPRRFVLRPDDQWRLRPQQTIAFGRAPDDADVLVPLVEEDGVPDSRVSRTAGRLAFRNGYWWLKNHASGSATITVSAPGVSVTLSNQSDPWPVRLRRVLVTVVARDSRHGAQVEHRFMVMSPWRHDDLPQVAPPGSTGQTTDVLNGGGWEPRDARLLSAWAYPELIGLAHRPFQRMELTRRILGQEQSAKDPNEKPLATLRRRASRATGVGMVGTAGSAEFLRYVVDHRGYLGESMSALHREFERREARV